MPNCYFNVNTNKIKLFLAFERHNDLKITKIRNYGNQLSDICAYFALLI